jgi:glyoxylase-like metal-dependent hydrolase (beta-lactamase superfamily II)
MRVTSIGSVVPINEWISIAPFMHFQADLRLIGITFSKGMFAIVAAASTRAPANNDSLRIGAIRGRTETPMGIPARRINRVCCVRQHLAIITGCIGLAAIAGTAQAAGEDRADLSLLPVQGNVYLLHGGANGNIAVQSGADGVMLVNSMPKGMAARIAAAIATLTPKPIRYIINTGPALHQIGNNAELAAMGMFGATDAAGPEATLVAHENQMLRLTAMTAEGPDPFPGTGVPKDAYFTAFKDIFFNGEPVFVIHEANAITDGDSIVLFRKSDTIAVGDLFTPGQYPVIDPEHGGSMLGLIKALNHVLDLAVPERLQEGGTRIIPGRGRLCNEADLVEYRDMVVIVRDRVRDLIGKGKTLAEIQAARPTRDYDPEYGSGEAFVRAIHASLTAAP